MTPTTVARRAGVSRQWLYTCEEAMAAINAARGEGPMAPPPPGRAASVSSLKRRLEAATDANKRLRRRVDELESQVALLYGQLRVNRQNRAHVDS